MFSVTLNQPDPGVAVEHVRVSLEHAEVEGGRDELAARLPLLVRAEQFPSVFGRSSFNLLQSLRDM